MSSSSILLRNLATSLAIICALVGLSAAQSGRRAPQSKPVAESIPEPTPTPTSSAETPKPLVRFVVGMEQYDSFSSASLSTYSAVLRTCARRLEEPEWAKVEVLQSPLSRGAAVNRAKTEKDSYVVWLRLHEDQMSSNQPGTANNVYIEYAVFSPGLAKIVVSGGTYPKRGNANVILGPTTSGVDGDYNLNKAARETADRILAKVSLRLPHP